METMRILDHGYMKLITSWGTDEMIVESARMSTQKGFLGWGTGKQKHVCWGCKQTLTDEEVTRDPDISNFYLHDHSLFDKDANYSGAAPSPDRHPQIRTEAILPGLYECETFVETGDEKLLSFMWKNAHSTPFEFVGATIEVQAPIFVFREWHRHRMQSYSEASARYSPLPDFNYVPELERVLMVNETNANKQAGAIKGADKLSSLDAEIFREELRQQYVNAEAFYQRWLGKGVSKELARLALPVGRYSKMRASTDLRNWLSFLTLRTDKNAQWEIRQYANAMQTILTELFPRTLSLWYETAKR